MKFQLGNKIRDRVSGAEGITTAYIVFLNGCIQWSIHQPVGDNGEAPKTYYYDEQQLEFVDNGIADIIEKEKKAVDNKKNRSSTGGAPSSPVSMM